ncbi:D-alanyl-D-alanine carboxypeptidase/D-alanyl-D-alanine-endopeptidase [Yinghuangia sp. ASG 101]|uniref:D-alanyl-D-alanine carboxypeptidase/D-alanyl-D-alanine endopeptidase n=1 Tax=Yinghuangia sp. ASG 101 TaxID=2896848 RepID=UPI001E47DBE6|nr:D-alanyl-D-alanine carboxypeptidase/D-alanyl-D-alanine-endopeptidase [Yinghuangia sp. ASG 101]UGQ09167.1 D-alanyl-D-alanine carboxypeptidase/D-alanyl-D-alanine-endopeptidase [Yinghuangia sp. ASG 101]
MALGATIAGVVLALLAVWAAGPWRGGYRVGEHHGAKGRGTQAASADVESSAAATDERRITPPVLTPVDADPAGPAPTDDGVRAALAPLLADPALGDDVAVSVVDAVTGRALFTANADRGATPASTTKITTAVAALSVLPADYRLTTSTVLGASPDTVVLVGGGDPTLTALDGAQYAGQFAPARLDRLAAETAAALRASGRTSIKLAYDTTLFTGPVNHPISPNDNIASVVPLMTDEGRTDATKTGVPGLRVTDPAVKAAEQFAQMLAKEGIAVNGKPAAATAPPAATRLAAVQSPLIAEYVEHMMTDSDNDMAEALLRHVAIAKGKPASFEGGTQAVREALTGLGVDLGAMNLKDGSGLDKRNELPPAVLTRLITLTSAADHPELRTALTGMPIAGFTGTLADRFGAQNSLAAAGLVRAKTGSLTGVSTLAGVVRDHDGRLIAFAFLADDVPGGADVARPALDRMAAALAGCGCGTPVALAAG